MAKYLKVGDQYRFQRNPEAVAFRDRGSKLETQTNSAAVADSMVRIAQTRGWDEIRVTGSETFKREVWMEAAARECMCAAIHPRMPTSTACCHPGKSEFRGRETSSSVEGQKTREQDKAEAFKNERPETAMQKFPTWLGPMQGVEAARRHVEKEQLSGEEAKVVMARINKNAHSSIERGHIPQVQVNERSQDRDLEKRSGSPSPS